MLKFALDGMLSFSLVPLKLSAGFGFLCAVVGFLMIVYGSVSKMFFPETSIPGWALVFVAIVFLGGAQLITIGILGEYLGRIYEEAKGRPIYIVEEEVNFE